MTDTLRTNEGHELHEGAWAYLSFGEAAGDAALGLRQQAVEACEASGWPAVSWSRPTHAVHDSDSARFFDGMGHAVQHADVVVALIGRRSPMIDAERAFACRHGRPVVALRLPDADLDASEVQSMLESYGRAQLIDCEGLDDCAAALRAALSDSSFVQTIHDAALEGESDG